MKRSKYQEMHVLLFWTNQFFTLHHLCLKGDRFLFWPFDNIKLCTMPCTPLKMRKGSPPLSTCTKYFGLKKQNKLILNNKENNTSGNTTSKKSIFQISYIEKLQSILFFILKFMEWLGSVRTRTGDIYLFFGDVIFCNLFYQRNML